MLRTVAYKQTQQNKLPVTARGMKLRQLSFLSSMSLRGFFQRKRKADAHQSSLENDGLGALAYTTSNVTTAPAHTLPGRDSMRLPNDENDGVGALAYTSNVTTALAHTLPGRDSVRLPDEADFSLTDTLGVAGTSQLEVTTDYSTRPSGNQFFPQFSFV